MRRTIKLSRLLLALILALVAAGCGGDGDSAAEGDTDGEGGGGEPIVLGGIFDLTGPTGDVGTPYAEGARAYFANLAESGGIDGREVTLSSQDYQYDVAVAEQHYAQYKGEGAVAILGWGTADTEALVGQVTADELPYFSGSLSEELADPAETPYNFLVGTTYSDQMRIALAHIAEDSPGANVAVFHNDSPFGESPLADGEAYIDEAGLDIASYETYAMPGGATDYVGELSQARGQDVTHIVIQNVASPAAQLVSNIASQGLDVQVTCLNWCTDELFIELAGDAAEGVWGVTPWYTANLAEAEEGISAYLESEGQEIEDLNAHFLQGWYYADLMTTAIAEVVDSGDEVTGPALKAALEGLDTYETGSSPDIDFSEDSHKGMTVAPVLEVSGGEWTQLVEPLEP
jgi:branched-chain amino acid transport system substrate-binding protein